MLKVEEKKGITLVALIVTIIILLILAGVAISQLGQNGLFNKTRQATEETRIAEIQELLEQKAYEVQIAKAGNATLQDFVDYLGEDMENLYVISLSKMASVTGNIIVGDSIEINVQYGDYNFKVNENLDIEYIGKVKINANVEATYEVKSQIDENNYKICINYKSDIGIQSIVLPNGNNVLTNNKKNIAIDYDVENGKEYTFNVQFTGSDEKKEYILRANSNSKPEIKQNESNTYPVLKDYGVELNKKVTIDYGENTNNYYSLDEGNTWIKYTEDRINIKKEGNLLAKSIIDGEITKKAKENITMQLASDALGDLAYDNDNTTYSGTSKYATIEIDKDMQGKKIIIDSALYTTIGETSTYYEFLDKNKEIIGDKITPKRNKEESIPEDAMYIRFKNVAVYEILNQLLDISCSEVYPIITMNGIQIENSKIIIQYPINSRQKLYSFDNENWNIYTEPISLEFGNTIYVKILDENNNIIGRVVSQKIDKLANDALGNLAYDNDNTSYSGITTYQSIQIDENMQGKKIIIDAALYASSAGNCYYEFLDENKEIIGDKITPKRNKEESIPEDARYIRFKNCAVYEI